MRLVLAGVIAVGVAFAVVLGFGFWIRERTDAIPDGLFGLIAAFAIVAIAIAMTGWMLGRSPWREFAREVDRISAGFSRVERTASADRVRRRSPAQIRYDEDRNATAACVHLQPIERAMRMAGVGMHLLEMSPYQPVVRARCRINESELRRAFALPASIYYKEGYEPERSQWDNPRADIICAECIIADRSRCDILVLHPDECRDDTPWFPPAR